MTPILLNHDVREVIGYCDVNGFVTFNRDIDLKLYDFIPNVCYTCSDDENRILKRSDTAKLISFSLVLKKPDVKN